MARENWLRTDELNEAVRALEIVEKFLSNVISDTYYWKWVVIALHNSLQGFMVCALRGSSGLNVLKDKVAKKWSKAYQSGSGKYPVEILDTYLNLYKKIKSNNMKMYVGSKKFCPKGQEDHNVKELNQLRNKFIHFTPAGWSLEVSGLPIIIKDCIAIIEFLAFTSNNIHYPNDELQSEIREMIDKIRNEIAKIEVAYDN